MADIELVIKIDENTYHRFINGFANEDDAILIEDLFKNGTILPNGHKGLIDVGQCNRKLFYQQCGGGNSLITVKSAFDMLMSLPPIIEADKE